MTDNFSDNPTTRIFSTEKPPELRAGYERLPEIENQIVECSQLSETEFAEWLAVQDFHSEKFLRAETLICLLNLAHAENLFELENLIAERLFLMCRRRIRKILQDKSFDADFIEETVRDIYAEMIIQNLERTQKSYDFWEVRFYKALTSLVQNHIRKHSAKYRATALFSELSTENEVEFDAGKAEDFSEKIEIRETNKKVLEKMPEDLRKIFILYFRDGETQKTIAERLSVTDRTVRNKLEKINKFLDEWRRRETK